MGNKLDALIVTVNYPRLCDVYSLNSRHPALNDLQSTLEDHYDAASPHSIGNSLLTSTLKRQCNVDFIKELLYKDCTKSATILPVDSTCPFPERKRSKLFDPARTEFVLKKLREADSVALKLWSKTNEGKSLGSDKAPTAFYRLAETLCPIVNNRIESKSYF